MDKMNPTKGIEHISEKTLQNIFTMTAVFTVTTF
jgi:hypothetical protein